MHAFVAQAKGKGLPSRGSAPWIASLLLIAAAAPRLSSAQSAAEWNQLKAKCGLPASTVYNTWASQGAPCGQSSSPGSAAADAQLQFATQATMAGAKMIGEGIHDALFGKPETPEHYQLRIAAKQLNNSGVWYMRQGNYTGAIVEFQKALDKMPNDSTILGNLTLARRLQAQSSLNKASAAQNSDSLENALRSMPVASRPSSWDRPQALFEDLDVNFTSNTVNLQNAPPPADSLRSKQAFSDAFDQALRPDSAAQRDQLNSEFDKLAAPVQTPAQANSSSQKTQPAPAANKKQSAQPKPASTNSQNPGTRP